MTASQHGHLRWKKQRKDSHKEVERRRRENINTAINVLSDLLPVRESSKAAILARAAEYIFIKPAIENRKR
nr:BBF_HP1_G0030710.mRNA.1.CDS.1 [Saccharomyces cerevisiae]